MKKNQSTHTRSTLSRRSFLGSVAAAGAAAFGSGKLNAAHRKGIPQGANQQQPNEDDFNTNIDAVKDIPRTNTSMPGRYPGVVAEVFHPNAVSGAKPNAEVAAAMVAAGMKLLTGEEDPRAAWSQFFSPKDRIGIKINPIGGKLLSNTHEVIAAIIANLEAISVPRENIIIWDRRQEQMNEVDFTSERYPGITCIGTEYKVVENGEEVWKGEDRIDKEVFYEFDIVGEYTEEIMPYMINGGTKSYFTRIITQMVDKVINVPVLKNAGGTVTLCLKNMAFGVSSNSSRGHRIWNRYISEICAFPPVRDKTVLNIIDGLKGCYEGGPGAVARYIWNANTVWVATDPVAADMIGWEKIFAKRVAEGVAQKDDWESGLKRYTKLARAEKLGLGTCQLDKIEHRLLQLKA